MQRSANSVARRRDPATLHPLFGAPADLPYFAIHSLIIKSRAGIQPDLDLIEGLPIYGSG